MSESTKRVNVQAVLHSFSKRILHDFRETGDTSSLAFNAGIPRERQVRSFFRKRLPSRYGVSSGTVIDAHGGQSKQCDIVIYDRERTPKLSSLSEKVWPFECVYAVAEVKSILTETELKKAVATIASVKALTREPNHQATAPVPLDRLFKHLNPFMGVLIAHDIAPELFKDGGTTKHFHDIFLRSVPPEHQLDGYCVVSGLQAFRHTVTPQGNMLGLSGKTFIDWDYGDGALATMLFTMAATMNDIQLNTRNLMPYLKYLYPKK